MHVSDFNMHTIHTCMYGYWDLSGFSIHQPRWAKTYGPRDHKLVKRILKDAGLDEVAGDDVNQ